MSISCDLEAALGEEVLRDDQWERIKPFVLGGRQGKRGPRSNGRLFVEALLWMARSGAHWKELPEHFGPPDRAKQRYYRWLRMGVLTPLFEAIAAEPDLQWAMLGATGIRAHLHVAEAPQKRGARTPKRLATLAAALAPGSAAA